MRVRTSRGGRGAANDVLQAHIGRRYLATRCGNGGIGVAGIGTNVAKNNEIDWPRSSVDAEVEVWNWRDEAARGRLRGRAIGSGTTGWDRCGGEREGRSGGAGDNSSDIISASPSRNIFDHVGASWLNIKSGSGGEGDGDLKRGSLINNCGCPNVENASDARDPAINFVGPEFSRATGIRKIRIAAFRIKISTDGIGIIRPGFIDLGWDEPRWGLVCIEGITGQVTVVLRYHINDGDNACFHGYAGNRWILKQLAIGKAIIQTLRECDPLLTETQDTVRFIKYIFIISHR
jgi:hypothetical protein